MDLADLRRFARDETRHSLCFMQTVRTLPHKSALFQRPLKFGGRFSMNARGPSIASADAITTPAALDSTL